MKLKKFNLKNLLFVFVAVMLCSGCKQKSSALAQTAAVEQNFSAEEAEKYLSELKEDYRKQAEEDIKSSSNPEIKKLADYKIKYSVRRNSLSSAVAALNSVVEKSTESSKEKKKKNKDPLKVIMWGPQDYVPARVVNPEFYVTFSLPVKELSALSVPIDKSDVFTIDPPVKGKYRWNGTRQLNFIPSEPLDPSKVYTITVNKDLKSTDGKKISGDVVFVTKAEDLRIMDIMPGRNLERTVYYSHESGVPLEYAGDVIVRVNSRISAETFSKMTSVLDCNKENAVYTATAVSSYYDDGKTKYKPVEISNLFYLKINKKFGKDEKIYITTTSGVEDYYYTLRSFHTTRRYFYPSSMRLEINFNQSVDKSTVMQNIVFSPSVKIDPQNIIVSGKSVCIDRLSLDYDTKYYVTVKTGLRDRFGQYLESEDEDYFEVPKAASYLKSLDNGNKILEAQFPHKFIYEYQNLLDGGYKVESTEDPLDSHYINGKDFIVRGDLTRFDNVLDNKMHLQLVDLDPYLKQGLGFVKLSAVAKTHNWSPWSSKYYDDVTSVRTTTIQVTDLGVTARAGYDSVVAMVRKLSDNTPVEGAEVFLYVNDAYKYNNVDNIESFCMARGVTGKDGIAEIKYDASKTGAPYSYDTAIFVRKGNDKVTYNIDNHYPWRSGVSSESPNSAYKRYNHITFMFTDRGLYKPGETVSFRGVARILTRDGLQTEVGSYEVRLEKRSWDDDEEYGRISGTLSASGGFYGSFDLPKDLKPGNYSLCYYNGGSYISREDFTVAYFEKAKFQTSAKFPDVTNYNGDTITAELSASYLAGGALTGASYYATWYKQPVDYIPPVPEAQNYVFGPLGNDHYAQVISEANGKVSDSGVTRIQCPTSQDAEGQATLYNAEISVTDISNQRIFTGARKIVHPGLFYIGAIKRFTQGFPSTKQKVDIPFVLFKPDGTYADASLVNGKINYKISRTYWTYTDEDGVDGIYSSWHRVSEDVTSGSVASSSKGSVSFTPEHAGFYTIAFTATDKNNNHIKTERSFYVTGSDYSWFDSENAYSLRLTPDKDSYKDGETAKLLLETPLTEGDYLITIERDTIYSSEVRHITGSCSTIEIPVKKEYLPVFYVSISSYSVRKGQPTHEYGEVDLGKPHGYYGVCAVKIDLNHARYDVKVTADKNSYRPGSQITLELEAKKDGVPVKNSELTVMVVDRAVVDLINYHVQNPIEFFYDIDRYPLAVIGGDSRSYLMDPVTYKVKTLQGGDSDEGDSEKSAERKDFRPTALFEPMILTDENGKAKVTFKLPDSLTTYRVTVFGIDGNQFAIEESEVQVQNPINVQSVQPRRLRVRDTAESGVIVTNLDEKPQKVTINVSIRAPQKTYEEDAEKGLLTVAGDAVIDGAASATVTVPAGKTVPVYFNVAALAAGNVELVYEVKSALLNERLISPILIEKPYTYETVTTTGVVGSENFTKNEKLSESESVIIPSWVEDGMGTIEITLDPTQIGLLGSSVKYVFNYPYGCLEQQSSRIWPLLIFGDYIDTFGLKSKVDDPRKVITSWFAKVKSEQHSSGALPYWPGSGYASPYVSLRFAHMYYLAKERGYTVQEIGYDINSLKSYLSYEFNKSNHHWENSYSAYACYVFSLLGDNSLDSGLDKIYKSIVAKDSKASLTTMGYAGLAYRQKKDSTSKKRAKEIADIIRKNIVVHNRSVSIDRYNDYYCGYCYGMYDNDSEALGAILQLFVELKPSDQLVDKVLFTLLQKQKSGYWQSTATTARVFESIYTLIKERKLESLDFVSTAIVKQDSAGQVLAQGNFKGLGAKPVVTAHSFTGPTLKSVPRNVPVDIEFTKDGKGSLYYTVQMNYAIPDELCAARDEGFEVIYSLVDEEGNSVTTVSPDSKVIILESGKTYTVKVSVVKSHSKNFVAVRLPVPSGAEIVDSTLSTGASKNTSGDTGNGSHGTYSDWDDYWGDWDWDWDWEYYSDNYSYFYDNEAQFFNNYLGYGTTEYTVKMRASRKGVYPTPPVTAECMYEPEIFGRSDGYLFIIK